MILEDKALRNDLRNILQSASEKGYLTESEANFTSSLFEKLDSEIARKTKDLLRLEGEVHQLRLTKGLIINMIKDSIAAAERAIAREETAKRIREGKSARETIIVEKDPAIEEVEKKVEEAKASLGTTKTKTTTRRKREK